MYTKYNVGRYIIEHEQEGKERAAYGKQVLGELSRKIEERFGEGWSVGTLKRCRKFYSIYSAPAIGATVLHKLEATADHMNWATLLPKFVNGLKNSINFPSPGLII